MSTKLLAATALAGTLAMASFIPVHAAPAPGPTQVPSQVTLVAHNGEGGGGGHGGGGWGGSGGHPGAMARGDGGGRGYAGPRMGDSRLAEGGDRGRFVEHGDRGRFVDHGDRGRVVERHDRGDRFEHRRFTERDRDFDRFHNRHRVFRNGVWVWVYGPGDYYAYNDCWWLRERALDTGSPYWWSRYNYCVGYY